MPDAGCSMLDARSTNQQSLLLEQLRFTNIEYRGTGTWVGGRDV
jgi:hypothetical protein